MSNSSTLSNDLPRWISHTRQIYFASPHNFTTLFFIILLPLPYSQQTFTQSRAFRLCEVGIQCHWIRKVAFTVILSWVLHHSMSQVTWLEYRTGSEKCWGPCVGLQLHLTTELHFDVYIQRNWCQSRVAHGCVSPTRALTHDHQAPRMPWCLWKSFFSRVAVFCESLLPIQVSIEGELKVLVHLMHMHVVAQSLFSSALSQHGWDPQRVDKWVMRTWRLFPWKWHCVGAKMGTHTATVPRRVEICVSKKHDEYPGEAERALSEIHLQFIEAAHGESSRGVYHGNCWGLMASRADWAVGLLNNELFSPINLALTYKESITCYTSEIFFSFGGGECGLRVGFKLLFHIYIQIYFTLTIYTKALMCHIYCSFIT